MGWIVHHILCVPWRCTVSDAGAAAVSGAAAPKITGKHYLPFQKEEMKKEKK